MSGRLPIRRRGESGQTSLLIIGFAIVAAMMVAVVVDASAAFLRRQALHSVADGAALAAADGLQGEQVYTTGLGERAEIDPDAAAAHVAAYLDELGVKSHYSGLKYRVEARRDRVTVTLSTPLDLPFTPPGFPQRPVVTGTAAAVVFVSP